MAGVRLAARVAPAGFNPQSADPAGAEACRYSENRPFIFASSEPFCGHSLTVSRRGLHEPGLQKRFGDWVTGLGPAVRDYIDGNFFRR